MQITQLFIPDLVASPTKENWQLLLEINSSQWLNRARFGLKILTPQKKKKFLKLICFLSAINMDDPAVLSSKICVFLVSNLFLT